MRRILIAAGGTGGHIFPAIVYGKRLEGEGEQVEWMCGSRELERTIYGSEGITPIILPLAGSPLGTRSPSKVLGRMVDVLRSIAIARREVKRFDEVYLFGGYISFAPLVAAKRMGIPVSLHEQNAVAGKVTRLASKCGVKILTGWPKCEGVREYEYVGIPVREPESLERKDALRQLGLELDENAKIVGIAGGSLGSGPLREKLMRTAEMCKEYEFVFLSSKERENRDNMHFILSQWDMNPFYSVSDVLVCRSGGSTLAEALKWGTPTITIPWEGAMDNHQEKNAREFVELSEKGLIFPEEGSPEDLARIIGMMM